MPRRRFDLKVAFDIQSPLPIPRSPTCDLRQTAPRYSNLRFSASPATRMPLRGTRIFTNFLSVNTQLPSHVPSTERRNPCNCSTWAIIPGGPSLGRLRLCFAKLLTSFVGQPDAFGAGESRDGHSHHYNCSTVAHIRAAPKGRFRVGRSPHSCPASAADRRSKR